MTNEDKLVLIMEDLDTYRIPLERKLKELGYSFRSAPTRQEFLQIYHETKPYAAILDNNVPEEINGQINKNVGLYLSMTLKRHVPGLKLALHTESTLMENPEIRNAVDRGITYMKKPISIDDLKIFLDK
jgi:CheY-like chemotaxis protein